MTTNLLSLDRLHTRHEDQYNRLQRYLASPRQRDRFPREWLDELYEWSAADLPAVNCRARTVFAGALCSVFPAFRGGDRWLLRFVTLCPRRFAMGIEDAPAFRVEDLVAWTRRRLRGFHYVATVEAAYYVNTRIDGVTRPVVSWHVHAVVWTKDPVALDHRLARIEATEQPLLTGATATHQRPLRLKAVAGRLCYMSKAPFKRYKMYPVKRIAEVWHGNPPTPELVRIPTDVWRQRSEWMTRHLGEAMGMVNVMSGRTLRDLTFADGDGVGVLHQALHRTVRVIRREDAAEQHRIQQSGHFVRGVRI